MRVVYAALLLTLVGLPASAQKPAPQKSVAQQKAAPLPARRGDMNTLLQYELRTQQWADRVALAADRGESMGNVDYYVRTTSQSLHGGEIELKLLQRQVTPADAQKLATIAQHHAAAQKAFDALRAELNVKDRNPSKATVMKLAFQVSDEATLAQGKTPPKHPIIQAEPATPTTPGTNARPKPDQPKG